MSRTENLVIKIKITQISIRRIERINWVKKENLFCQFSKPIETSSSVFFTCPKCQFDHCANPIYEKKCALILSVIIKLRHYSTYMQIY